MSCLFWMKHFHVSVFAETGLDKAGKCPLWPCVWLFVQFFFLVSVQMNWYYNTWWTGTTGTTGTTHLGPPGPLEITCTTDASIISFSWKVKIKFPPSFRKFRLLRSIEKKRKRKQAAACCLIVKTLDVFTVSSREGMRMVKPHHNRFHLHRAFSSTRRVSLGVGSSNGNSSYKLQTGWKWESRMIASVQRGSSSPCLASGTAW